ncbi:LEAF RUST 10 DISEASE-RESISTANCE LOCUS RECEPTOR-LIKE PROTEIN KINASE-like 2.2 [Glycine soja]|uniref:LEAF RUST 10 DISEASE-RESISTANCE LOCUS RECEPTOR-LIKE PROTEIN KINASE-like 2.2 n=1 Tax=Glycine soja TaxID=3848 RepID=A0A445G945_GLYSO|nr:LEAF RUST 10 DISEASE-RESISTANCE LOCUS RECEPTOR-LIKE PROTEIN KINASE-like 2.2 [Glycine soja]
MTRGRGTPGYAALELWMPNFPVTHKCYVYSFGILLFEIIGRRRNLGVQLVESQEWFPIWIWKRFDAGEFQKLIIACGIKEKNREITERMVDVALSFVQYRPDSRPIMSDVVKMLEGSVEILKPLNPFQPFMDGNFTSHPVQVPLTYTTDTNGFSDVDFMAAAEEEAVTITTAVNKMMQAPLELVGLGSSSSMDSFTSWKINGSGMEKEEREETPLQGEDESRRSSPP